VTTAFTTPQRTRALLLLIVSILWYEAVEIFTTFVTQSLAGSHWYGVVSEGLRLILLLAGFTGLAYLVARGVNPTPSLGWPRNGETRWQIGTGAAIGWGMAVALVLFIALAGRGLQTYFDFSLASWMSFLLTLVVTLLGAAVRQTVFAGFPFRRLVDAAGPSLATILVACFVGFTQGQEMQGSRMALLTVILLQVLFCVAALRTGSLWLGWALDVAARTSLGTLFGLPVAGSGKYGSLVLANSQAPEWISGGSYGPIASLLAPLVVLAGIYFMVRATRTDVIASIRPGGIAVDLEARHAPSYPGGEPVAAKPAGVSLVQILPTLSQPPQPDAASRPEAGDGSK